MPASPVTPSGHPLRIEFSEPMRKILRAIDMINDRAASGASWLVAILVVVILFEVVSRYVFNSPTTWGFGAFRLIGGGIVVLGWAYAQRLNSHIRVDILYVRFSIRTRAIINLVGSAVFFFPIFGYFIVVTATSLWRGLLGGKLFVLSTGGAPPSAMLYKTLVLIGLCLFFLQYTAQFIRDLDTSTGSRPS